MKPFAIEPDDRAFALARDGVVLESSPSAVSDGSTGALPGADGWHTVRRLPTTTSTQHAASVLRDAQPSARALSLLAAELARRLAAHPPLPKERVWIAAPAGAGRYGLGALLGVARQLALPVDGFVDAAVVSVASLGGTGPAVVIELGLHHAAATLVERDAGPTCRRRSLSSDHGGLLGLYQSWLDLINTAMVRQTRFDALRDASTEQQLFEALPELSREAMAGGVAVAALTAGGERIEMPLTRDQLIQAAQPLWREIARLLHELRPAGSALTLLVPRLVSALPGFREMMTQFTGCELVSLPAGFAALGIATDSRGTCGARRARVGGRGACGGTDGVARAVRWPHLRARAGAAGRGPGAGRRAGDRPARGAGGRFAPSLHLPARGP